MPEIRFSEKELEDFLCQGDNLERYLGIRFVARQVKIANSYIDILGYSEVHRRFVIIELKKQDLHCKAFFQVCKYAQLYQKKSYRTFARLLIGQNLHEDLFYSVEQWSGFETTGDCRPVYYALFGVKFDEPLKFNYYNVKESTKYEVLKND